MQAFSIKTPNRQIKIRVMEVKQTTYGEAL